MISLIMHGRAPSRILLGEGFPSCQEDRAKPKVGDLSDVKRFERILADSNLNPGAVDPEYNIVMYEETEEAAALALENKKLLETMWRDEAISAVGFQINDLEDRGQDAAALRAYRVALTDYPLEPDFPNGARPTL